MHGLVVGYPLIELIRVFLGAVLHAGSAARALVLDDVTGFLGQGDMEITKVPLDLVHLGKL